MVFRLVIILSILSASCKAQDSIEVLNFNSNTRSYLMQVREFYKDSLLKNNADFQPVLIADSTYILNPMSLTDHAFQCIVDSVMKTTWQDSIYDKMISTKLLIHDTL